MHDKIPNALESFTRALIASTSTGVTTALDSKVKSKATGAPQKNTTRRKSTSMQRLEMLSSALTEVTSGNLEFPCHPVDNILFETFPELDENFVPIPNELKQEEALSANSTDSLYSQSQNDSGNSHGLGEGQDILLDALASPVPSIPKEDIDAFCNTQEIPYVNVIPNQPEYTQQSVHAPIPCFDGQEYNQVFPNPPFLTQYPFQLTQDALAVQMMMAGTHQPYPYSIMKNLQQIPSHSYVATPTLSHFPLDMRSLPQTEESRPLTRKTQASKRYKLLQPSKFCHVCVRSGDQVKLAACANVTSGLCRKAVCEKCFEKHGFGHEWAAASLNNAMIVDIRNRNQDQIPENAWTCFHCRSKCPPSAQCKIYARTNKRRHIILKQRKAEKERVAAERAGRQTLGAKAQKTMNSMELR